MTNEFQQEEQEVEALPITTQKLTPRNYDVQLKSGALIKVYDGFLGINQSYVAIADDQDRLIFASPLPYIDYAMAIKDKPLVDETKKSDNVIQLVRPIKKEEDKSE